MNRSKILQARKARLIKQIQHERVILASHSDTWQELTSPIDSGWQFVLRHKYLVITTTVLLTFTVLSKPAFTVRWARHLLSAWSSVSLLKKLFN